MKQNLLAKKFPLILIFLFPFIILAQPTKKASIIAPNAQLQKLGDGFTFTEGPAADSKGNVYFTDQPNNKILKWDAATEKISVFLKDAGRSNGMYFDKSGRLITCADMENQVWSIDNLGNHTVVFEKFKGKLLNGPNDLWIAPNGGIYFTDPLYKRDYWERDTAMQQESQNVYYLASGSKEAIPVEKEFVKPNGIVGAQNGKNIYITDIGGGKTYVYDIEKDGSLTNKALFANMGSDGMTIDNKGNVYLTGNGVTVFNKKGEKIAHIPVDEKWTANVCFGGTKKNMLFITATTGVYGLKMKVKGVH